MHLTRESAEVLSLQALVWLAANDDLLPVFLGSTGSAREDLRDRAGDPVFLAAVLDFLMMDDAWVLAFSAAENIPPERVMQARSALPGGDEVNWT